MFAPVPENKSRRLWLEMPPTIGKLFIVIYRDKATKFGRIMYMKSKARINPVNFVRIAQGVRPLWAIILVKFQNFKVLET